MKKYPFKFLDAYGRDDAGIFFGRSEEINALYEMVFQSSVLLIYGASGTGKTSLIQCGLASKFQSHDWLALTIRRGSNINTSLEKSLADSGGNLPGEEDDLEWLKELMDGKELATTTEQLSPLARSLKAIYLNCFKPIYLIFDQFEELYILGSKTEEQQFIETIQWILKAEAPVKIIFCIREEYLGYLDSFERAVPQLLRKKLRVEPMNMDKVRQVIVGATSYENSNVHLQTDETNNIAEGIFEKIKSKEKTLTIELPYLQVFLDKFYIEITKDETRTTEAVFTTQALKNIGDIGDVLRNFLEEQVVGINRKLSTEYPGIVIATIWKILSPFATLEGTKEPIGKHELYDRLPDINPSLISATVEECIRSRILRYTEDVDTYEIAHDSLARRIAEKRSDEEIALLEIKRLVKSQTSLKADVRELFSEKQLNFIEPFFEKLDLTDKEKVLIDQSYEAVANEKAAEQKQLQAEKEYLLERQQFFKKNQKSQKRFIGWISVALFTMIGLAIWAYSKKQVAEVSKRNAQEATRETELALAKANKLINAFYFYDEKFALAIKDMGNGEKYGFINKEADPVIDYKYEKAEQFDYEDLLAKVKRYDDEGSLTDYLIDTTGKEYKVAYTLKTLDNDITALDLRDQQLTEFPREIMDHPQLRILLINKSVIKRLAGIGRLKILQMLDLSYSQVEILPHEIGALENLEMLNLEYNKLKNLPEVIKNLKTLQTLWLGYNQFQGWPDEIGQLKSLHSLDVSGASIKVWPATLEQLKELQLLMLDSIQLTVLPASIGKLIHLKSLGLSYNNLTVLPADIGKLTNLKTFGLRNNQLTLLPPEVGQLTNLHGLALSNNQLTVLPAEIKSWQKLEWLDLINNQLSILPAEIGQLKNLQTLNLDSNKLSNLPAQITQLKNLNLLSLSFNNLLEIPTEINYLISLQFLGLSENQLKILPPEIGRLKALQILDLHTNKLAELPEEIGRLNNLEMLILYDNLLTWLPAGIGQLQALQSLGLSDNQLTILPQEIGQLSNLKWLYLDGNKLTVLPTEIGLLKTLEHLSLENNKLTVLPDNIGKLKALHTLDIRGNLISKAELERIQLLLPTCLIDHD
ncbi:MAG: AAA family ATPase [Chitinophagaceae bacterium]